MEAIKETTERKTMSYVVTKHLVTLFEGGVPEYTKEANIMTWNQTDPKLDIRRWEKGYPRKGIALSNDETRKLFEALQFHFFNKKEVGSRTGSMTTLLFYPRVIPVTQRR